MVLALIALPFWINSSVAKKYGYTGVLSLRGNPLYGGLKRVIFNPLYKGLYFFIATPWRSLYIMDS